VINITKNYRNIYILESRDFFWDLSDEFIATQDLILTFDFGLKHEINKRCGEAYYVDNLCSQEEMQENNLIASKFLKKWHYDELNRDIFTDQGVPIGFSFRIELWSEIFYYARLRTNLQKLRKVKYQAIIVGQNNNKIVSKCLNEIGLQFKLTNKKRNTNRSVYFFDNEKYMRNALHGQSLKDIARNSLISTLSFIWYYIDLALNTKNFKKTIYAQIYHPTKNIVEHLLNDKRLHIVTASLNNKKSLKKYFVQRMIPIRGKKQDFDKRAALLFQRFKTKRTARFILNDGTNITAGVYDVIEHQIEKRIAYALRILNSVILYIKKQPIHFEIMIANLGLVSTIVDCVLQSKGVPRYLIINGLMTSTFGDEAKYASHINSYGAEIKKGYFNNADNVVCLGDPRMDLYIDNFKNCNKKINRLKPVICIGTSGFNSIDLISHVAIEFDFMFDLLSAFQELMNEGHLFSIVIKVRPNGVLEQYKAFVAEYFNNLEIDLQRTVPIYKVLQKTDLYISIYSQTLFEASCLGIPVIYYKKDKEYHHPPFDAKSELVTVENVSDLKQAFLDFKEISPRFDSFLDKSVMEKYIGPLNGKNTENNMNYIYELLQKNCSGGFK